MQNLSSYYRICLERFIPKDVEKCLYIDVDMLVLKDIRELFAIDLDDRFAAVVYEDKVSLEGFTMRAKRSCDKDIIIPKDSYFNAGLMLLNLDKWRKCDVESQCLNLLQRYHTACADQDVLNIVFGDNVLRLDYGWNVFISYIVRFGEYIPPKDYKIYHYLWIAKPWIRPKMIFLHNIQNKHKQINLQTLHRYSDPWWEIATQTPIFDTELVALREDLEYHKWQDMLDILCDFYRYIRILRAIIYPHRFILNRLKNLYNRIF